MQVTEFLNESSIKVGLEARTKLATIEELVDMLIEENEISLTHRNAVIEAVLAREKMISTGLEHGVAIPHGAVEHVDGIVAAMGISKQGIDFQSMDGKPAHIIILLISPVNNYGTSLQTLAGVSRLLVHEELRQKLRDADDAGQAMEIIMEEEERELLAGEA